MILITDHSKFDSLLPQCKTDTINFIDTDTGTKFQFSKDGDLFQLRVEYVSSLRGGLVETISDNKFIAEAAYALKSCLIKDVQKLAEQALNRIAATALSSKSQD